jgi:hypothetical protein
MEPTEPIETVPQVQVPRYSRAISWLGGATFGRRRKTETESPRSNLDGYLLAIIQAAFVGNFMLMSHFGPRFCIAVSMALLTLGGLWLRRFRTTTTSLFRWAAYVTLAMQAFLFLPQYIRAL